MFFIVAPGPILCALWPIVVDVCPVALGGLFLELVSIDAINLKWFLMLDDLLNDDRMEAWRLALIVQQQANLYRLMLKQHDARETEELEQIWSRS